MTMERNYESQMRPFDSSFCLIVLTKKKKKKQSLETNNYTHHKSICFKCSVEVSVFWIPYYHSCSKQRESIYGVSINILTPGYQTTARLWL